MEETVVCPAYKSEFVWIGICEPIDEEMLTLKEQRSLHPFAIEDAVDAMQVPWVDVYGDQLFVVARTATLDGDQSTIASPRSSSAIAASSASETVQFARTRRCVSSWRRCQHC